MWKIEWIDKSGKWQTATVTTIAQATAILDSLENAGIDPSTFKIQTID